MNKYIGVDGFGVSENAVVLRMLRVSVVGFLQRLQVSQM